MMGNRIDIPSIYDEVRKAYAGMGYPVSGDRLVVSEQPTYVDGRPVPKDVITPNSSGGNTQGDGTVRINPRYRAVMRHWGLKGSGRDFLRTIIGHELGHHVDHTVLRTRARSAERRRLLKEIADSGFHTVYTDSYGPGTDRRKLDKELLAEYLAKQVSDRLGKSAEMDRSRIQAQYARHPQESLDRLAARLARKKWGPEDVRREYESHSREYGVTKDDKEFLDRYIISCIGAAYDRKAAVRQALMRRLWETRHAGESFDAALPGRMARFRQYEDIPFPKSAEGSELRDGTYGDVKAVYDALSDREKDLITPGRTVYKDVPVLSRTVAYDGDAPVGFADWYGRKGHASLCVAVSDRARGRGLAGKMAIDSIRKILARIRAEREQAEREGGDALREWRGRSRLRRFVWGLADGNDASARAAEKAGFREQLFKRLHKGRRFVLSRADAERVAGGADLEKEAQLKAIGRMVGSLRGLFRHSPIWKARRVLSTVPREQAKIRYGYPSVDAVIPPKPGTSRVYRGSGDDVMTDLARQGILSRPSGYDAYSRGLYGFQGWHGTPTEYWDSFPESVRGDIMRQMSDKVLATNSPSYAAGFTRSANGRIDGDGYVHAYDIPSEQFNALRWAGDAGQQRGILKYVKGALSAGKPVGQIPVPFGEPIPSPTGSETAIDRSLLRQGYAGSVHRMLTFSPFRDESFRTGSEPLARLAQKHENRLGRSAGFRVKDTAPLIYRSPRYDMNTFYRDQGDIRTFSPVDDALERMKRLEASGWRQTWLDRLTELVSPTIQR